MTELFSDFVAVVFDGRPIHAAAIALGVDKSTVSRDCKGVGQSQPAVALRIE